MFEASELLKSKNAVLSTVGQALAVDGFLDREEEQVARAVETLRARIGRARKAISHMEYRGVGILERPSAARGRSILVEPTEVAKIWSTPGNFAILLYRLTRLLAPTRIVEIGTCVGISGLYLLHGSSHSGRKVRFATLEGSPRLADIARENFSDHGFPDADVRLGVHAETLPRVLKALKYVDFAYVDGSHIYEEVLSQHRQLIDAAANGAIIFHDDIRWSHGMRRAWADMLEWRRDVSAAIDLGRAGVCVVRRGYRGRPRVYKVRI